MRFVVMSGLFALVTLVALPPSRARADTPASDARARATQLVGTQLVGLTDPDALLAQLGSDTVIVGNGALALARSPEAHAIAAMLGVSRTGLPALTTEVTRLDAGATRDALWLTADIVTVHRVRAGRGGVVRDIATVRLTELVVADGAAWRVAVLAFTTDPRSQAPGDALGAAGNGAVVGLLASPSRLDDALAGDVVATFDATVAVGADDVRRALEPSHASTVRVTSAIEVHGKTWAFALGSVTTDDAHATVLVIVADGRVVALHSASM